VQHPKVLEPIESRFMTMWSKLRPMYVCCPAVCMNTNLLLKLENMAPSDLGIQIVGPDTDSKFLFACERRLVKAAERFTASREAAEPLRHGTMMRSPYFALMNEHHWLDCRRAYPSSSAVTLAPLSTSNLTMDSDPACNVNAA